MSGATGLRERLRRGWLLASVLLCVPIAVLLRLLRPILLVRVGPLISDQIGHFGANTELYLCRKDLQGASPTLDVFYLMSRICNQQLRRMWERKLLVNSIARPIAIASRYLPGAAAHVIPLGSDRDPDGLLGRRASHLTFTEEEIAAGMEGLRRLGIPDGTPFICFHSRDAAYLDWAFPHLNLKYHNYRDVPIRDCLPAAEALANRGYLSVRMGAVVKESLPASHPRIIDYATSGLRSDLLDLFLIAGCRFFLGAAGGLNAMPRVFRRPAVFTNVIPYGPEHLDIHSSPGNLFIPKKLWLRDAARLMTFREMLDSGAGDFIRGEQFDALGIDVRSNEPEEITALAIEMDERLQGTWRPSDDDEALQHRFWSLFERRPIFDRQLIRIGAAFLRQHRHLLD